MTEALPEQPSAVLTHPTQGSGPADGVGGVHTVYEVWDISVGQIMLHIGLWEVKRLLLTWAQLTLLSRWFFLQPQSKGFEAGASRGLWDN